MIVQANATDHHTNPSIARAAQCMSPVIMVISMTYDSGNDTASMLANCTQV